MLAHVSSRYFAAAAIALIGIQIAILHTLGQPFLAASGRILLWVNDPWSPDMSQQLADWYSFSHVIHGFVFFGVLRLIAPGLPLGARLLLAMGVEIGWEITENSPAVIQHYRQQALAAGYVGDSILNSVSDVVMMSAGFLFASRVRGRTTPKGGISKMLASLAYISTNRSSQWTSPPSRPRRSSSMRSCSASIEGG